MPHSFQDIILIADPQILAIPIEENREPLVDIKDSGQILYGPTPEVPESDPYYTKMRRRVFQLLCEAQSLLPSGVRFKLYEGWRSFALQKFLFENRCQRLKKEFPNKSHEEVFQEATKIVSPVTMLDGQQNVPPHTTGAAVDVYLVDDQGSVLDMGMDLYHWAESEKNGWNYTYAENISPQAKNNRQIMIDVLSQVGFVNYPTEWWHWSYGDRYWAYHKSQPYAFYGPLS